MDGLVEAMSTIPCASVKRPASLQQTGTGDDNSTNNPGTAQILSPPTTPIRDADMKQTPQPSIPTPRPSLDNPPPWTVMVPKPYAGAYTLHEIIGHGAWSSVHRATASSGSPRHGTRRTDGEVTPPLSPGDESSRGSVLAIKRPAHRAARRVLAHEARVLTYLSHFTVLQSSIIGFHGLNPMTGELVLQYAETTLAEYATSREAAVRARFSTRTMFDPVIGNDTWLRFAKALVSALSWLHGAGCVHGDVKASNILLRPGRDPRQLEPVFCDFSSASVLGSEAQGTADDAITPGYAAPEVLASYAKGGARPPPPPCGRKADVWALAVALVFAAVGEEPYQAARNDMQKLAMARAGGVLDAARAGSQGTRVMRGRMVERAVAPALRRDPDARTSAELWRAVLDEA